MKKLRKGSVFFYYNLIIKQLIFISRFKVRFRLIQEKGRLTISKAIKINSEKF